MNKISEKLMKKLPKYAQAWEWTYLYQGGFGGFEIDASCKASKEDSNQEDLVFVCDNWEEFIWWVRRYKRELIPQHRAND
jgi:hypothetical protein